MSRHLKVVAGQPCVTAVSSTAEGCKADGRPSDWAGRCHSDDCRRLTDNWDGHQSDDHHRSDGCRSAWSRRRYSDGCRWVGCCSGGYCWDSPSLTDYPSDNPTCYLRSSYPSIGRWRACVPPCSMATGHGCRGCCSCRFDCSRICSSKNRGHSCARRRGSPYAGWSLGSSVHRDWLGDDRRHDFHGFHGRGYHPRSGFFRHESVRSGVTSSGHRDRNVGC